MKVARTVLNGGSGRNAADLHDRIRLGIIKLKIIFSFVSALAFHYLCRVFKEKE